MLIRYRWYRVKMPKGADLGKIIRAQRNIAEENIGFSVYEDEFNSPKYRFFLKTKVTVARLGEDNLPFYEEVSSLNFTDFAIVPGREECYLRIENPSRNIRELFNVLESIVGLGFTAKPLSFPEAKPKVLFESVEVTKLLGLKVVGAVLDEDLVARMEFASKEGMHLGNIGILGSLRYKIESATYELIFKGTRGQVMFSANGTIKISGQLAPKLLHLIECELPNLP